MDSSDSSGTLSPPTRLVTMGRDTKAQKGFVNPPVVHGSTVLYPTVEDLHAHRGEYQYGRHGTQPPGRSRTPARDLLNHWRTRALIPTRLAVA